eukprot:PhM_4_TR9405/c1_g1_i1/m.66818
MNLKFTVNNSSGTITPTFLNPWNIIDKIEYKINGGQTETVSHKEIVLRVAEYLSQFPEDERYTEMLKWRTEIGTTLGGETVPTSSSLAFNFDLFVVLPEFKNYITKNPISLLSIKLFFISGTGNADVMAEYVVSSTTGDSFINTAISLTDMSIQRVLQKSTDPMLFKHTNSIALVGSKFYEIIFESKSWNSVGVDKLICKLNENNALTFNKIQDVTVLIDKQRSGVAFNYADSQKYYSGPNIIGFKIIRNNKEIIVDLSGTAKLQDRRRYLVEFYKRRYGTHPPTALLDDSTLLSKYYMWGTRIDFSNIHTEFQDDYAIAGVSNSTSEWSLELTCEGAVSTTCDIHVFLHPFAQLV